MAGMLLLGLVWLIVLSMVGTPRALLLLLSHRMAVPPSWIFLLSMLILFLVCGFCIGGALCVEKWGVDLCRYRGAFFFAVALPLCYLWYAVLFGAHFFLIAALLALFSCLFFFFCAINFWRVSSLASMGIWLTFLIMCGAFLFSILCFFTI